MNILKKHKRAIILTILILTPLIAVKRCFDHYSEKYGDCIVDCSPDPADLPYKPTIKGSFEAFKSVKSTFWNLCRRYPTQSEGLNAFFEKPVSLDCPDFYKGSGAIERLKADPWGKPFKYINDQNGIDLISAGPDGIWDTKDDSSYKTFSPPSLEVTYGAFRLILENFKNHCKRYPSQSEGINAFFDIPKSIQCSNYPKGFIPTDYLRIDPWGRPYKYINNENGIDLISAGPDGVWDTEDDSSYKAFDFQY